LAESTERYQAERTIRVSDQRFAAVFRSNPCAMAIMSLEDDRFLDVNGTFERTSGFTRAELLGRTTLELGMWIDETERTALLARLMVDGRFQAAEVRFRQKSGEPPWSCSRLKSSNWAASAAWCSPAVDVTAIQEVEARHKAILQALPDWVFLTTSDGTFLEFHARDQRHLHHAAFGVPPPNVMDVLPHELAVKLMNCFSQASRSRQPATLEYSSTSAPSVGSTRFGGYRRIPIACSAWCGRDGSDASGAAGAELQEELAHTGRAMALGALTGSLAHEINQPLSAINNNAHAALLLLESGPRRCRGAAGDDCRHRQRQSAH
jgi:PAS domain S-box-containing protein